MSDKITTTTRTINYFEIEYQLNDKKSIRDYFSIFDLISERNQKKDKSRILKNGNKSLNLFVTNSDADKKMAFGKIVDIRMDAFPELIKTSDDKVRDIEVDEDEGILESSHFVLSVKGDRLILSLEHNQYGPRISDFYYIANHYLFSNEILKSHTIHPLTNDTKIEYADRIDRVSYLIAKVHKDNIKRIENVDKGLFSAMATASEVAETEYVSLKYNVGKKQIEASSKLRALILKITTYFSNNDNSNLDFDTLQIRAIDTENEMKMKDFDLLNIWIKSHILVEKKPKSRVVLTTDIHEKMKTDHQKQMLLL